MAPSGIFCHLKPQCLQGFSIFAGVLRVYIKGVAVSPLPGYCSLVIQCVAGTTVPAVRPDPDDLTSHAAFRVASSDA